MNASLEINHVSARPREQHAFVHCPAGSTWPAYLRRLWGNLAAWKPADDHDRQPGAVGGDWRLAERVHGASARLILEGDANSDSSVLAVVACGRRMLASQAKRILLDLRGVRRADTRLIASLVLLRREAGGDGKRVVLRASRCVCDWACVCRVEGLLNQCAASGS